MSSVKALYSRLTPSVIPENQAADVILEVKVEGTPTAVKLELQSTGTEVSLRDDGARGDKVAGDGIFTGILKAVDVLANFGPANVNRNFVGHLRLYKGKRLAGKANIFVDIVTASIPVVSITPVSPVVQYTEHLVNIVDPGFFPSLDTTRITRMFYSLFGDDYDFINVISEVGFFQNAHFEGVRSDVQGIGIQPFDHGMAYGSGARLLGCLFFPEPVFFDGASPHYQHELGHHWINSLPVPPLDPATPHWPLSDLASDMMGWGSGKDTEGLEFNFDLVPAGNDFQLVANSDPRVFSDLSLYLMGFLPPSLVGTHFVFVDQAQPWVDGMLHGPVTHVGIGDIVNKLGARVPDPGRAQRKFRVATIMVSKNALLPVDAMRQYDYFSARAEETHIVPYSSGLAKGQTKPFYLATRGIGRLDTRLKRRILVDASRDGGVWWFPQAGPFDTKAGHQGKALADCLRSLGHTVVELPRPTTITPSILVGYDIVVRAVGFGGYAPVEIATYQDYVQNGGNLLLLAEHRPADALALSLGLRFAGVTRGQNALTSYETHPLTRGVGPLVYGVGSGLISYPGTAQILGWLSDTSYLDLNDNQVQDSGEPSAPPVLGVMIYGSGRIVFCGDANLWETVPQPLVVNTLRWFDDPHQIQEATLYEGMKAYTCGPPLAMAASTFSCVPPAKASAAEPAETALYSVSALGP